MPPWATGIQRIVARLQGEGKPTPEDIAYREELKSHELPEDSSLFSLLMRRLSGNTPGRDAAPSAVAVALAESRYVYHELEYRRLEREYRRCEARVAHGRISLAYDEELFRWGLLGRSGVVLPGQIRAILRNRRFCPLTPFALELERYSFKLEERRRDKLARELKAFRRWERPKVLVSLADVAAAARPPSSIFGPSFLRLHIA